MYKRELDSRDGEFTGSDTVDEICKNYEYNVIHIYI